MGLTSELINWIKEEKPFCFVRDTAPICYGGEPGLLVWDRLVWNELTFVDNATRRKQSLFTDMSEERTKAKFDELVSKHGISD